VPGWDRSDPADLAEQFGQDKFHGLDLPTGVTDVEDTGTDPFPGARASGGGA